MINSSSKTHQFYHSVLTILVSILTCVFLQCFANTSKIEPQIHIKTLTPGILNICFAAGYPPFIEKTTKGEWEGWDLTYLKNFAKINHLIVKPIEVNKFDDIWMRPGKGECDIAAGGITNFSKRKNDTKGLAIWSHPYHHVSILYAVRLADKSKLNKVQDLENKTIIVSKGWSAYLDLLARLKTAKINSVKIEYTDLKYPKNAMQAGEEVRDSKMNSGPFAYAGDSSEIQYMISKLGGLVAVWPHCMMENSGVQVSEPFSFVVRKDSVGLIEALNKYIDSSINFYPGGIGLSCESLLNKCLKDRIDYHRCLGNENLSK